MPYQIVVRELDSAHTPDGAAGLGKLQFPEMKLEEASAIENAQQQERSLVLEDLAGPEQRMGFVNVVEPMRDRLAQDSVQVQLAQTYASRCALYSWSTS